MPWFLSTLVCVNRNKASRSSVKPRWQNTMHPTSLNEPPEWRSNGPVGLGSPVKSVWKSIGGTPSECLASCSLCTGRMWGRKKGQNADWLVLQDWRHLRGHVQHPARDYCQASQEGLCVVLCKITDFNWLAPVLVDTRDVNIPHAQRL